MLTMYSEELRKDSIPITRISASEFGKWHHKQPKSVQNWIDNNHFSGKPGTTCYVPNLNDGSIKELVIVLEPDATIAEYSAVINSFKPCNYHLESGFNSQQAYKFFMALGLVAYDFNIYKNSVEKSFPNVSIRKDINLDEIQSIVSSVHLVRDLINTPANDMGPRELATSVIEIAKSFSAKINIIEAEELLNENYPAIYTVGMASVREPLLIDFTWGDEANKKITLVGKGVCFDSGGLDLKPSSSMLLMKKDMAGAALVLGLAKSIMEANLPVRLRVLIPAVENSVSGEAYRPLDVIRMRSGKTVEVSNTDAEGRLIIADALTEAVSEKPDLIIDATTLTGAIRIALGTDLPAVFSNDDNIAKDLVKAGSEVEDHLWHLPLWDTYKSQLKSKVADISSTGPSPYGGALLAALFLSEFIDHKVPWIHIDMVAWNFKDQPGKPEGGEAPCLRALFAFIKDFSVQQKSDTRRHRKPRPRSAG